MIVPQRPGLGPNTVNLGRPQARLVWLALAVMGTAAVIGAIAGASASGAAPNPQLGELFLGVGSLVVLADLAIGFFVTSKMRKNAPPGAPPDAIAATQVIVGSATALSGLLVSAVFFFITQQGLILLLALPCAAVLLSWFPSESRWAKLRPAGAAGSPGEPRRNPMVR
jgi:uncharacterized membrane protein YfcA